MLMQRMLATAVLLTASLIVAAEQDMPPNLSQPQPGESFGAIAERFEEYEVILRPDTIAPEWWAGAPSVARDDDGVFWLAARMRTADAQRGLRGYEIRILRSEDGVDFDAVHAIHRDDIPIGGFERPALLRDPASGLFKLYLCGPWEGGPWGIFKLDDAASPAEFDPGTARLVIEPPEQTYPRDQPVLSYKDPVIIHAEGQYHCFVSGYMRRNERIYHLVSEDGEQWEPVGNPYKGIMPLAGWHDFFVRPASVVPIGVGYLFVYEGGSTEWYDPVYNIATGLGFTFDLHTVINLTPAEPLLASTTPGPHFATFRYSHWMLVDEQLWVYAEVATPDETFELRLYRVDL